MIPRSRIAIFPLAICLLLAPALPGMAADTPATNAAAANTGGYIKAEAAVGRAYNSNLFWSVNNPQSDTIWRLSPALEAGYKSQKFTFGAYSSIDAERYAQHPELNSNAVRRYTTLLLGYQPNSRWSESLFTAYTSTDTPQQLTPFANLQLGRVPAHALTIHPEVTYRFSETTTGSIDYTGNRYQLAGSPDINYDAATIGTTKKTSQRNSFNVAFSAIRYEFGTSDKVNSKLLLVGWKHNLTPNTEIQLSAGPRRTDGSTTGEYALALRHTLESGTFALGYYRSQTAIIGLTGPVDTEDYTADFAYSFSPHLTLHIGPDYMTETNGGAEAKLYRLNLAVNYRFNDSVALISSYQYSLQRGLFGIGADQEIKNNSIYLGLVFSFASKTGDVFTRRSISPFETSWPVSTKEEKRKQQPPPRQ